MFEVLQSEWVSIAMNTPLEIRLFDALKRIQKYMTPDQLRRGARNVGLEYEEHTAV